MLKCCKHFMLFTSLVVASFVTLGCGGGDDDGAVDPSEAVPATDNPGEEPPMDEGP